MKCIHYLENRFPCGKCIACRLNRQRDKKIRIMQEVAMAEKSCFLTLTYDDAHLPANGSLVKKDVQDFLKRFRKRLEPDKIRYFCCGEYGDQFKRPHYHLIIFGIDAHEDRVFKDLHFDPRKKHYQCKCLSWVDKNGDPLGFVTIADVNEARCAYVAKYCVKKVTGKMAEDYYQGRLPEFCLTSQGLGLEYIKEHADRLKRENCVSIRGKKLPLPRYIVDKIYTEAEKFRRSLDMRRETGIRMKEECVNNTQEALKNSADTFYSLSQYLKDQNDARVKNLCNRLNMKGKADYV